VIGPTLVLIALWPRRLDRRIPTRLAFTGLGLVGGAAVCGLYLEAPYGTGASLFGVSGSDISNVMDEAYGRSIMVRLAVVVVCGFLLRPVLAGRGTKTDHVLLAAVGAVGVSTWAFAGHSVSSSVPPLTVVADSVHVASVAVWLGGLVMLVGFLLRKANARELRAVLPVWSNWATLAITVLVLGGAAQALIEIGSLNALLHTTYGRLILVKVGLLGVILLVAAGARRLAQLPATASVQVADPVSVTVGTAGGMITDDAIGDETDDDGLARSVGDDGGQTYRGRHRDDAYAEPVQTFEPQVKRLRRSVLIELALAVAVLVATSILVQSSPVQNAAGVNPNSQGTVSLTSSLYTLQVDFLPSGRGTGLHMFFYDPAGGAQPVKAVTIVATSSQDGGLTQNVGATRLSDSHWTSTAVLTPGKWTFTFTVRTTDIDEASVSTTENIG
jgi:copper transport protein